MDYSFLSDEEKVLITAFMQNGKQVEAVKKVLLMALYNNGTLKPDMPADPTKNWALGAFFTVGSDAIDDNMLGAAVRASAMGIQMLESGLKKLSEIATPKKPEGGKEENPAR